MGLSSSFFFLFPTTFEKTYLASGIVRGHCAPFANHCKSGIRVLLADISPSSSPIASCQDGPSQCSRPVSGSPELAWLNLVQAHSLYPASDHSSPADHQRGQRISHNDCPIFGWRFPRPPAHAPRLDRHSNCTSFFSPFWTRSHMLAISKLTRQNRH